MGNFLGIIRVMMKITCQINLFKFINRELQHAVIKKAPSGKRGFKYKHLVGISKLKTVRRLKYFRGGGGDLKYDHIFFTVNVTKVTQAGEFLQIANEVRSIQMDACVRSNFDDL